MNCAELEPLLCDYVDGTLDLERRRLVESHIAECALCAEIVREGTAAVAFTRNVPRPEPPQELITRILFELPLPHACLAEHAQGFGARLWRWFELVLQPRFAMGMAMTILSFALLGRFAGIRVRQLGISDLSPVEVWHGIEYQSERTWARVVQFYDSLRFVYELRSRLSEMSSQDSELTVPVTHPGKADAGQNAQRPNTSSRPSGAKQKEVVP
jgi:hypothetical protein